MYKKLPDFFLLCIGLNVDKIWIVDYAFIVRIYEICR